VEEEAEEEEEEEKEAEEADEEEDEHAADSLRGAPPARRSGEAPQVSTRWCRARRPTP
jgi:hypothetical protein